MDRCKRYGARCFPCLPRGNEHFVYGRARIRVAERTESGIVQKTAAIAIRFLSIFYIIAEVGSQCLETRESGRYEKSIPLPLREGLDSRLALLRPSREFADISIVDIVSTRRKAFTLPIGARLYRPPPASREDLDHLIFADKHDK